MATVPVIVTTPATKPLAEDDKQKVLVDWNATDAFLPEICVQDLIQQQIEKNSDSICAGFENESEASITYHEFNLRTNRVANFLVRRGVKPDDLIGVCCNRTVDMLIAMVGIIKSGAAYVALDPSFPMYSALI
eukprot:Opistho-2@56543